MNAENKEKVEQIKAIVDTLSDLRAIKEIENYMYNSRHKISCNALNARKNAPAEILENS
jgi:spore coat polysaccharide biosynthesis protein SpsF (cytidylyltransferase family)